MLHVEPHVDSVVKSVDVCHYTVYHPVSLSSDWSWPPRSSSDDMEVKASTVLYVTEHHDE